MRLMEQYQRHFMIRVAGVAGIRLEWGMAVHKMRSGAAAPCARVSVLTNIV